MTESGERFGRAQFEKSQVAKYGAAADCSRDEQGEYLDGMCALDWKDWRAAFEAGRGQERKRFDDAGVYFCWCGHINMEHCADAGWMKDPNVKYSCTLCPCKDCVPAPPDSGDKKVGQE